MSKNNSTVSQDEYECILNALNSDLDCAHFNSQDEKQIVEIMKKDLNYPSVEEINTQQFIEITLRKIQNKQKNKNAVQQCSSQTQDVDETNAEEDIDICNFKKMCDDLMIKSKIDSSSTTHHPENEDYSKSTIENIQLKPLFFEQVNSDKLCCINDSEPIASILNSSSNHCNLNKLDNISKPLKRKVEDFNSCNEDLSGNDCIIQKYNKKSKFTYPQNNSKMYSKLQSSGNVNQLNTLSKFKLFDLSSSEDDDCIQNKNPLPAVRNTMKDSSLQDVINVPLEVTNSLIIKEPFFRCSEGGQIHKDMIDFIKQRNIIMKK